ncbi:hypothetical protein BES08_09000 [Novosphingobium resinovorum]|uniref:Uncharacterized protein n=1 Tax=Novosphingobium resinovorum TaxID=158500 RepID=A0A1D8A431_9SPHN|nr:hypothetical protein BES08_09000 [Novosphingobium resinovorum]
MTDYSADFALNSNLAYLANVIIDPSQTAEADKLFFVSGALIDETHGAAFNYTHEPERLDLLHDGATVSFTAQDRVQGLTYALYEKDQRANQLLLTSLGLPAQPRYTALTMWRAARTITDTDGTAHPAYQYRVALMGSPSSPSDPLPDSLGYTGGVTLYGGIPGTRKLELSNIPGNDREVYWSYTPSSTFIFGSIPLSIIEDRTQVQIGLLAAEGRFDRATNSWSGTLVDQVNGFRGTFLGRNFGPNRAELAIVFEFSRDSDGSRYVGHYIGRRP